MLSEHPKSFIENVIVANNTTLEIVFAKDKDKQKDPEMVSTDEFIGIKGIKAIGNQLTKSKVKTINIILPEPVEEPNEGFEAEDSPERQSDLTDAEVTDADFPEEGTIGDLFEFPEE